MYLVFLPQDVADVLPYCEGGYGDLRCQMKAFRGELPIKHYKLPIYIIGSGRDLEERGQDVHRFIWVDP